MATIASSTYSLCFTNTSKEHKGEDHKNWLNHISPDPHPSIDLKTTFKELSSLTNDRIHRTYSISVGENGILIPYRADAVNELAHIDEARDNALDGAASECGSTIILHNMERFIAISRLHHHYPLRENERIAVTIANTSSSRRLETRSFQAPLIIKTPGVPQEEDIPYIFKFDEEGSIIPLEYISQDCKNHPIYKKMLEQQTALFANKSFLADLFEKIKSQNNLMHLGFQLIFEDVVLPHPKENEVLHEDNWPNYQEVSYRPLESKQESTITSWRFAPEDGPSSCYCVSRVYCQRTRNGHYRLSDGHDQYD